tara:strand:+ start:3992 stop:4747 length:756 start_codon:yes stop_codon:yes gene_type:complete
MNKLRLISRLDIKSPNLVKGRQFEGLRKIGDPNKYAVKYYEEGIDEIFYEDIVASLYERNSLVDIIEKTSENIFVPLTVSGGLRSIKDVANVLKAGADKVAINTSAIKNSDFISEVSDKFGSQCMVLSIQAKKRENHWEAFYDNGREMSNLDVVEWAIEGEKKGAGEIILTSVDNDGMGNGFDTDLVKAVTSVVNIPIIVSGGMGKLSDVSNIIKNSGANAVAIARSLHYNDFNIKEIKEHCNKEGILTRL